MQRVGAVLGGVALTFSSVANAKETEQLVTSSKWQVHYADNKCGKAKPGARV